MPTLTGGRLLRDIDADWLKEFSQTHNEPQWLTGFRADAFQQFQALPWPTARDEHWKRTELTLLQWDKLELSPVRTEETPLDLSAKKLVTPSNGAENMVYWDLSTGISKRLSQTAEADGLQWMPLEQALKSFPALIQEAWKDALQKAHGNKFHLLTLALGNSGSCLFIADNKSLKAPIHTIVTASGAHAALFPINFVFVGCNAEAQIWEELVSSDTNSQNPLFVSSHTSINLGANSQAGFCYLQQWDTRTIHFQFQDIVQGADSHLNTLAVAVGGRVFHNQSVIHMNGQGAQNKVLGVLFGDGDQNFENWITQNHNARKTTSDIQYRGGLKGSAKSFFSGLVSIVKEAQQSDAFQSAKSLLLSKDARADAIPNLEILADDVKCAHGAAVGPVDEDQKFYLQTRGVAPEMAEKIIIEGFFEPVISEVPSLAAQERLRGFIEEKLAR